MSNRDGPFHTYDADIEVHDKSHLMRILSALRASEAVAQADRIYAQSVLSHEVEAVTQPQAAE